MTDSCMKLNRDGLPGAAKAPAMEVEGTTLSGAFASGDPVATVCAGVVLSLIVTIGMGAGAENSIGASVDVYLENVGEVPFDILNRAEETTAEIFDEIGISMHWPKQPYKPVKEGCKVVGVQFDRSFALGSRPDTMGYALPYSNSRSQVHIMIDRVLRCRAVCTDPRTRLQEAALLGHIIAHEIGHVLQGVVRHSEDGLMKESWTSQETLNMHTRRLSFTKSDADLIHRGFLSGREIGKREPCQCVHASR
jgi:hypothetical protein